MTYMCVVSSVPIILTVNPGGWKTKVGMLYIKIKLCFI